MSHYFGQYDQSTSGNVNIIMKELFSFLDPFADLKYQRDLLSPRQPQVSTLKIQEGLTQGELLLDTTEEEW